MVLCNIIHGGDGPSDYLLNTGRVLVVQNYVLMSNVCLCNSYAVVD